MSDCIFCKIIAKEIPAYIVWENEHFVAFLDMLPLKPGHTLVVPRGHFETIFDMPADIYKELFENARVLSTPLQKAIGSLKVGYVVEGFGVPHSHLHVVPIDRSHDLDSKNSHKIPDEEMKVIQEKIVKQIAENKITQ